MNVDLCENIARGADLGSPPTCNYLALNSLRSSGKRRGSEVAGEWEEGR
jgi:hypothetical protein